MKSNGFTLNDNGMTSISTSGSSTTKLVSYPKYKEKRLLHSNSIDEFSFTFISPLSSKDNIDFRHIKIFLRKKNSGQLISAFRFLMIQEFYLETS